MLPPETRSGEDRRSSSGARIPCDSTPAQPAACRSARPADCRRICGSVSELARGNPSRAGDPRASAARPTRHHGCVHWRRTRARPRQDRSSRSRAMCTSRGDRARSHAGVLAAADIGVAPFDVAAHRPLSLGFFWSPLKIFEYMASGLPVVAPAVDRHPHSSRTSARASSTNRRRAGASPLRSSS